MSIYVPPRVRHAIARQNICQALLLLISEGGEAGVPVQALREYAAFKAALDGSSLSLIAEEVARAERWLTARKLIRTDGVTLWVAPLADLRSFLAKGADAPAPTIMLPGAAA